MSEFMKNSGVKGFEPLNVRTKNECLTTWRYPNCKFLFVFTIRYCYTKFRKFFVFMNNSNICECFFENYEDFLQKKNF